MTDSQCMGRLLASATHDMRNVLAVIRESAGLAQDMVQLAAEADKPADPRPAADLAGRGPGRVHGVPGPGQP